MIWHSSTADEVLSELQVNKETGLTKEEAEARLKIYKKNEIHNFNKKSFISLLFAELKNYLYIILMVAAALYIILCASTDEPGTLHGALIIVLVIINAWVSAYGKYRSVDELDKLRTSITSTTTVIRDGEEITVPSSCLVPGDIMVLKTGDFAPADGRLIDSYVLKCDEFTITGEKVPIDKFHDEVYEDITPLSKRSNMVYSGCSVVGGHALAVVTETGESTEIGRAECIANEANNTVSPIKAKIEALAKYSAIISLVAAAVVFVIGVAVDFNNTDVSFANTVLEQIILGLSVAVAAIPEAIITILTFSLALGAKRLYKNKVTVSNLQSAELIKDITVICTDKTGVLTTNDMSVQKIYNGAAVTDLSADQPDDSVITILRLALICSNFKAEEHIERHANSVESAIEKASVKHTGMNQQEMDGIYPRLAEIPFDSFRRMMTTVSIINGKPFAIVKGAPEAVVERCLKVKAEEINKVSDSFAAEALKVIAVAMKPLSDIPANPSSDELENELTFVGLIGICDPLPSDSFAGVKECEENGIRVIMVTGDHIDTAKAVAAKLGILKDDSEALSSEELATLTDEELEQSINKYSVFARVTAEDKMRIVSALKAVGEKVLVTGDTVNDTPALLAADIGCALGATGSDVVRTASDIVVRDNRFASITLALKESRRIIQNVKKGIQYLFACNLAEIIAIIFGLLIFKESPLTAAAVLWINFITDGLPALAFATEKSKAGLSLKKSDNSLLNLNTFISLTVPALFIALFTLVGYGIGGLTLSFAVMSVCEIIHAFAVNTESSVISLATLSNTTMLKFCGVSLIIVLVLLLTPAGGLLSLEILSAGGWLYVLISSAAVLISSEITKLLTRKLIK